MSTGPPFTPDDSTTDWANWREDTRQLDYPSRDIRIIFPEQRRGTLQKPKNQPADFGDFDPNPNEPDPDVWPLKDFDPGHPADVDELNLIQNSFPAPHVAWVTEDYLEARYGYNPTRQEVDEEEIPPWHRPERPSEDGTVEIDITNDHTQSMELTVDRREALRRLANLWNGEVVRGNHLLLDKCPSWLDLFDDLNQDDLQRFVVDPKADAMLAEAFGEYDWYEKQQSVYLKPVWILRQKVWYAPTHRVHTLIDKQPDFPDLRGDPKEGLVHRFTVGLTALHEGYNKGRSETYFDYDGYNIDIVGQDENDRVYACEVMTGHHNWKLHRSTYEKLRDLSRQGFIPFVIFDSRETAYKIFNHWHKRGLGQLPRGQFNSDFKISDGRKRIQQAYENEEYDWVVSDWATTASLWRNTLGPDGPGIDPSLVKSFSW